VLRLLLFCSSQKGCCSATTPPLLPALAERQIRKEGGRRSERERERERECGCWQRSPGRLGVGIKRGVAGGVLPAGSGAAGGIGCEEGGGGGGREGRGGGGERCEDGRGRANWREARGAGEWR
jgi:hypothetical protein